MKTKSLTSQLVIRNLCVYVETKHILRDVNGIAQSGDLLAIMGPTGSGKTTLLNTIAGRVDVTSGDITLDGQRFNKQLRRRLGYVLQEDIFMSRLTLYETLYFTAMIRIAETVKHSEKCERIKEIIEALHLTKCQNTVIGDLFVRGLSGGEKKRANIACELLTDPDIMLIDEPTSGLDSSTAHSLMMELRNYATHYNKTIVATIHQPSSQVYHMFSTLLLLMDGHVGYFGKASAALDYFENIGFPCAIHFNPADFLLGLMKSDKETSQKILDEAQRNQKFAKVVESKSISNGKPIHWTTSSKETSDPGISILGMIHSDSTNNFVDVCAVNVDKVENSTSNRQRWPTSFWTQYRMLTWRQIKQSKGHIIHKYQVIQSLFIALVGGLLYFQTEYTYRNLRDKMGMFFFAATYWGFESMLNAVTSFPAERGVIRKERQSGAYRLSALYFAKMTSDMPLVTITPVFFCCITFWMTAMGDFIFFFIYIAIILLHCLIGQSVGYIIGAGVINFRLSLVTGNTIMLFSLLLSGFFNTHLPIWLNWAKYISMVHYPFATLTILGTDRMPNLWCNTTSVELFPGCTGNTTFLTKEMVLKDFGIDAPFFCYTATTGILLIVLRIIGYYVVRFKR